MQRGRLLIILGVILGLATLGAVFFLVVAGGGSFFSASDDPTPTPAPVAPEQQEIPTTEVIVALQPIPRGGQYRPHL